MRSSERSITHSSSLSASLGLSAEIMVEGVADDVFDDALRFDGGEAILGLADEFRLPDEEPTAAGGRIITSSVAIGGALVVGQFGIGLEALGQRDAQACLMGAAFGRRNGVAIGMQHGVAAIPGHRPFDEPWPVRSVLPAKMCRGDGEVLADLGGE